MYNINQENICKTATTDLSLCLLFCFQYVTETLTLSSIIIIDVKQQPQQTLKSILCCFQCFLLQELLHNKGLCVFPAGGALHSVRHMWKVSYGWVLSCRSFSSYLWRCSYCRLNSSNTINLFLMNIMICGYLLVAVAGSVYADTNSDTEWNSSIHL